MSDNTLLTDAKGIPFFVLAPDPDHPGYAVMAENPAATFPPRELGDKSKCSKATPCEIQVNPDYPQLPKMHPFEIADVLPIIGMFALIYAGVRVVRRVTNGE